MLEKIKFLAEEGFFLSSQVEKLQKLGVETVFTGRESNPQAVMAKIKDFDIVSGGYLILSADIIKSSRKLKLITFLGAGYNNYIDAKAAADLKIPVVYTPGANADSVAAYTLALIMNASFKIPPLALDFMKGISKNEQFFSLKNRTIGIVGMGNIGSRLVEMLSPFGANVLYYKRNEDVSSAKRVRSLTELFEQSDIISLNIPLNEETKAIINSDLLKKLRPNAVLVSTARVELIDKVALLQTLKERPDVAVAFDGFFDRDKIDNEAPFIPFIKTGQLFVTPHNAYNSHQASEACADMILEDISNFIAGKPFNHLVPECAGLL